MVPDAITGGTGTVAVRMPAHPVALEIIKGGGMPLTGTSANIHGCPDPTTAQEVASQLGEQIELIIDAGRTPQGIESTILDMSTGTPNIVRSGALTRQALQKFCHID